MDLSLTAFRANGFICERDHIIQRPIDMHTQCNDSGQYRHDKFTAN